MNRTNLKSIGAVLAGILLGAFLSVIMDSFLGSLGIISMENFRENSFWIVLFVVLYRFVFNTIGSYLTAKLAPNKPIKHVIIIGIIGTLIGVLGAIAMWDKAIPFYNIVIILISFPSVWLGGKLFLKIQQNGKENI